MVLYADAAEHLPVTCLPRAPFFLRESLREYLFLGGSVSDDSPCSSPAMELEPVHPAWMKVEVTGKEETQNLGPR